MTDNKAIFENLFNSNFADPGNIDLLKTITSAHPYFSPAQFFLLQTTAADDTAFEKQAVKTNILFNNPHWLHFQLQQTNMPKVVDENITRVEPVAVSHVPEPVIDTPDSVAVSHEPNPVFDTPENVTVSYEPDPVFETQENVALSYEPDPVIDTPETMAVNNEPDEFIDSPDDTDAKPDSDMEIEIEPMHIKLKMPEEKADLDEAMLFEPMHMVDYFASQGIKLTDEVQMADKLGKQLKSFTEWLKTMKKIHVENEGETTTETNDSIQTLAENSNTETEVLTESMAEVFVKQGKMAKAGEVYQKLSLLNPAKSAYFAAKIENLKGI